MGPIWGRQDPDGPMLAPWTLPSGKSDQIKKLLCIWCKTWRSFYNLAINILLDYLHDDVIKWKHYPRYWPFVRGIHRWPVDCPHKASDAELWCFFFYLRLNKRWASNRDAGDLRRHRTQYDVTLMVLLLAWHMPIWNIPSYNMMAFSSGGSNC